MSPRWVLAILALILIGCAGVGTEPLPGKPAHHVAGGFRNTNPEFTRPDGFTRWSFMARRVWASIVSARSFDAPRVVNDGSAFRMPVSGPSVTWIGHSTLLLQLGGINFLTDSHWGTRASPLAFLCDWLTPLIGPAVVYVDADDIVSIPEHNGGLVSVLTLEGERLAQGEIRASARATASGAIPAAISTWCGRGAGGAWRAVKHTRVRQAAGPAAA